MVFFFQRPKQSMFFSRTPHLVASSPFFSRRAATVNSPSIGWCALSIKIELKESSSLRGVFLVSKSWAYGSFRRSTIVQNSSFGAVAKKVA